MNIASIMSSWPKDVRLQAKGLTAMSRLIKMDRNAASVLQRNEACRIVVEALERHKDDRTILVRRSSLSTGLHIA